MFKSGKPLREKLGWFDILSRFNVALFEQAETNDMHVNGFPVTLLLNDVVIDVD